MHSYSSSTARGLNPKIIIHDAHNFASENITNGFTITLGTRNLRMCSGQAHTRTPDALKQLLLVTPGRHSWLAMESGDSSELEQLLSSRFLVHPMSHTGRLEGNRCSGAKGQLGKVPSEEGAFQEAQMDPWEVHQDKRPV